MKSKLAVLFTMPPGKTALWGRVLAQTKSEPTALSALPGRGIRRVASAKETIGIGVRGILAKYLTLSVKEIGGMSEYEV